MIWFFFFFKLSHKWTTHLSLLLLGRNMEAFYHLDENNLELVDIFIPIQKLMTISLLTVLLINFSPYIQNIVALSVIQMCLSLLT